MLARALQGGVEERLSLTRKMIDRLPLAADPKHRLWQWAQDRIRRTASASSVLSAQRSWDKEGHNRLRQLLSRNERIAFPQVEHPTLSLLMVLYNKAHLSILSLESILANADISYEVVIVDNSSSDDTGRLLERIDGAKIVRNPNNLGFAQACMQAAERAEGEYLCFFNNDALLQPHALSAAVQNFADPQVGAVGGKILLANGDLQEAGSIVWADGAALGYGRGDNPDRPEYQFRRPVDFCSGVFLLTPRRLFVELGGFSPLFFPAYYEDTDYCMQVWERNLLVIYEPRAVIRHYESASSNGNEAAKGLMAKNQRKFAEKWMHVLPRQLANSAGNIQSARVSVHSSGLRVLYIDDRVPHKYLGAGFPRSNDILTCLVKQGHHVTCAAFTFPLLENEYSDIARDVEVSDGLFQRERLVRDYVPSSDLIWVSRPHNMQALLELLPVDRGCAKVRLVYDAEAIFADRERLRAQITGREVSSEPVISMQQEISLAKAADAVIVVSEKEGQAMLAEGVQKIGVVGHRIDARPTPAEFRERSTFLFIGAFHGIDNPNADSMRYFCTAIWPRVREGTDADLVIAGYGSDIALIDLKADGLRIAGPQDDLTEFYNQARAFVVPTRYAAGIPYKAHEAAALGVPLVVSTLIGNQLGWENEEDCLVASGPAVFAEACCRLYTDSVLWNKLRANALRRVVSELSEAAFSDAISAVVNETVCAGKRSGVAE